MKIEHEQYNAINVLYHEMFSCMLSYAQIKLNDFSLAVQESFGIACLKANQVLLSVNPRGWMMNTLKNVIKNTVRNRLYLNQIVVSNLDYIENISNPENMFDVDELHPQDDPTYLDKTAVHLLECCCKSFLFSS